MDSIYLKLFKLGAKFYFFLLYIRLLFVDTCDTFAPIAGKHLSNNIYHSPWNFNDISNVTHT